MSQRKKKNQKKISFEHTFQQTDVFDSVNKWFAYAPKFQLANTIGIIRHDSCRDEIKVFFSLRIALQYEFVVFLIYL
jgi:hypothetical protein